MYRLTRTHVRGQFANDQCFANWLMSLGTAKAVFVRHVEDPLNNGGPNDKRYWVWNQLVVLPELANLKCNSAPDLVTNNGRNGWETLPEVEAVLAFELGQSSVMKQAVVEAIGTPAEKIAASVASDVGKAAGGAVDAAGKALDVGGPWVVLGVLGVAAGGLYLIFRK